MEKSKFFNFKIEKGIKIPKKGQGRKAKYPFADMGIGDSFIFGEYTRNDEMNACACAYRWGKRHSCKFTVRKTEDNKIRIWRIE